MSARTRIRAAAALAFAAFAVALLAAAPPALAQPDGVETNRTGARPLPLPRGDDVWHFAVFGDRTGGSPEGVAILRQAVGDVNLLDPDLVMTVGDLVQGYNATEEWLAEMREYQDAMGGLRMKWYPVAGNHDIYWRGDGRPEGEHEGNYERHFGPLWYWFRHKDSAFIALYTDEGDPADGTKGFSQPRHIRMSDAQLAWLDETLARTRELRHVFLFVHHPRWIEESYPGGNWDVVHGKLRAAGNVRAVFGGHIHRLDYRSDDGIEYFTLGTTGGSKSHEFPAAGYLHHYDIVTVRPEGIQVATLPVGAALDPRKITPERQAELVRLVDGWMPRLRRPLVVDLGALERKVPLELANPTRYPLEVTLVPRSPCPGWWLGPDHVHEVVAAERSSTLELRTSLGAGALPGAPRAPAIEVRRELVVDGARVTLPPVLWDLPVELGEVPRAALAAAEPGVLRLDGDGDAVLVASAAAALPDGPFTLEGWVRPRSVAGRRPFVAKTEDSEYALFISDGVPNFSVHLDGRYAWAESPPSGPRVRPGRWCHLAGVFDGEEVRLYVDGELAAKHAARGKRRPNEFPLCIGADPDGRGDPSDFLSGEIDDVRLSRGARYRGESFDPPAAMEEDADTVLWFPFDRDLGPFAIDRSGAGRHGLRRGDAHCAAGAKGGRNGNRE